VLALGFFLILNLSIIPTSNAVHTIYVNSSSGNDNNNGYSWLTAKRTLLYGIDAVDNNGTVKVSDGKYSEFIRINKNVSIVGQSSKNTILSGSSRPSILYIDPNVNVNISHFTIQNGLGLNYGGAITNYGTLNLNDCTLKNNSARYQSGPIASGGAIYNTGTLSIINSTLISNSMPDYVGGAIFNNGKTNIQNCLFYNNSASIGAAISNWDGVLTITESNFNNNIAGQNLGGTIDNRGNLTVHYTRFYNNQNIAIISLDNYALATNNWWGSNSDPKNYAIYGNVYCTPWVILTIKSTPNIIYNKKTSKITADLNHVNGGGALTGRHIPEGTIILNINSWGSFTKYGITRKIQLNTVNGIINTTYYANGGTVPTNPVQITATADSYTTNSTESAYVTIKTANLNITNNEHPKVGQNFTVNFKHSGNELAGKTNLSKTTGMQNTGAPFVPLIMALSFIIAGIKISKTNYRT
jgi:hypothetical protein